MNAEQSFAAAIAAHRAGRLAEAERLYGHVLAQMPVHTDAALLRGEALAQLGRHGEAIAEWDRLLRRNPNYAEAWRQRGVSEMAIQRVDAAIASFTAALTLQPEDFESLVRRGNAFLFRGDAVRALPDYDSALRLQPDSAGVLYNRATSLNQLARLEDALADYERAFALEPGLPHLEGALLHARMHACDWRDFHVRVAALLSHVADGRPAAMPFQLVALPASAELQRQCAQTYAARKYPAWLPRTAPRRGGDRIRIAYLSGGLRQHATALLMVEIFERHDRTRFETIALSFSPDDGSVMRGRLKAAFDQFLDVSQDDDERIAARLAALNVDIAIDLDGFTLGSRTGIIARCPAPLRVSWLGYPGTSGAPFIDYLIADTVVAPPGRESEFREAVARLPGAYQPNSERDVATAPSRADCGLPEQGFVFCAFNNSFKITPDIFAVWMRLLTAIDGSVLWILEADAAQKANLTREAAARGVDAARLVFAPRLDPAAHLARHVHADLFLDTWYCNAHTTASDALGMGVPLLTCVGPAFPGRVAASLLTVCGLPDLITHSLEQYEAMALKLACDTAHLVNLKNRLRQGRSKLFDTEHTTRALESAYQIMWDRARQGLPPEGFDL